MLSSLVQERIGVKWTPIRTNDRFKKGPEDTTRTFALHIEGASNCTEIIRQKLAKWYGSQSRTFPDGTKMWLVPPFHSIFFSNAKPNTPPWLLDKQPSLTGYAQVQPGSSQPTSTWTKWIPHPASHSGKYYLLFYHI
jgi:hypothetical protein